MQPFFYSQVREPIKKKPRLQHPVAENDVLPIPQEVMSMFEESRGKLCKVTQLLQSWTKVVPAWALFFVVFFHFRFGTLLGSMVTEGFPLLCATANIWCS
jgi:hypothetical protein